MATSTHAKIDNLMPKPIVWTIAGSDSGGGAGIQADLLTMHDLQCHGCSVISSITAQNSVNVTLVEAVSEQMLITQLDTLWADLTPVAIKIGLLANQQQIDIVAKWLSRLSRLCTLPFVVLDPVMVASSGAQFCQQAINFTPFAGLISLLTPNQHELFRLSSTLLLENTNPSNADLSNKKPRHRDSSHTLTNQQTSDTNTDSNTDNDELSMIMAAKWLANHYRCHVLAKGGDAAWQQQLATDVYVTRSVAGASHIHDNQVFKLTSPRVNTNNNHGSGCTLSSAVACFVAHQFLIHDAIVLAKAYVNKGLSDSYAIGAGPGVLARSGWPNELSVMPTITNVEDNSAYRSNKAFRPVVTPLGVYPVLDSLSQLHSVLEAGCRTVQFRVKLSQPITELTLQALEQNIIDAITLGRDFNAQLFINDHWQLAIKHRAFGVHLGQEDLASANLEAIAEAGLALGISSHSYFEALLAHQCKPSYIALGHIYPTTTKQMPSAPQGVTKLTHYVNLLGKHYPTVAIGGVDVERLERLASSKVGDVAVVRAITQASHPSEAYRLMHQRWLQLTRGHQVPKVMSALKEAI
ncbi:thiamine phosphate synthase [Shewanella sp. MF05960]|uniref:thiamine phosphate synthase n=1 Tax=Shewanella sp. MF05960 TaxID=3434874 RepID=UPI003D7B5853